MVLQQICAGGHFPGARIFSSGPAPGASLRNRCYEPAISAAGRPDSREARPMAPGAFCARTFDHDFVIGMS